MPKPNLSLTRPKRLNTRLSRDVRNNVEYYCMMLIPLALIFVFSYLPMSGIVIAFQNYSVGKPFFGPGVEWVGLKHFRTFVTSYYAAAFMLCFRLIKPLFNELETQFFPEDDGNSTEM